jgi:hypothetical protein
VRTDLLEASFSALDISVLDQDETLSYASTKFYGMGQYENWYQYSVSEEKTFSEKYKYTTQVYYSNSSSGSDDNSFKSPLVSVRVGNTWHNAYSSSQVQNLPSGGTIVGGTSVSSSSIGGAYGSGNGK